MTPPCARRSRTRRRRHDLGRLWLERTGLPMVFAVWAAPEPSIRSCPGSRTRSSLGKGGPRGAGTARVRVLRALRLPGGLPCALLREAPLSLRPARARRALHVPGACTGRRRAGRGAGAAVRQRRERGRLTSRARSTSSSRARSIGSLPRRGSCASTVAVNPRLQGPTVLPIAATGSGTRWARNLRLRVAPRG